MMDNRLQELKDVAVMTTQSEVKVNRSFTWHWTGYFFHVECVPPEETLDKEARKMGDRPKDATDLQWLIQLQQRKREIMAFTFPTATTGECVECALGRVDGQTAVS